MLDKKAVEKLQAPFPPEKINWKPQTVSQDGNKALAVYIDKKGDRSYGSEQTR